MGRTIAVIVVVLALAGCKKQKSKQECVNDCFHKVQVPCEERCESSGGDTYSPCTSQCIPEYNKCVDACPK